MSWPEIVYVFSDAALAKRFLDSYQAHPSGFEHDFTVVVNAPLKQFFSERRDVEFPPYCKFLEHSNAGWDVGAFQVAAKQSSAELCVFLGSHTYFHRPYWLRRMAEAAQAHDSESLYGAFATSLVRPHIRTSAFWCDPKLLLKLYPEPVTGQTSGGDRYEFEHGERSLTTRWLESGRQALLITWDKVYGPEDWLDLRELQWWPPSQKNLLLRDKHVDQYREYGRCPAENQNQRRCEFAVNHQGDHYADGSFFPVASAPFLLTHRHSWPQIWHL